LPRAFKLFSKTSFNIQTPKVIHDILNLKIDSGVKFICIPLPISVFMDSNLVKNCVGVVVLDKPIPLL